MKSDRPIYAGSFTIKADSYEERIDNAIQSLKEEQPGDAAVATFLLTFFTCEIVVKSVIGHSKDKGTGQKSLPGNYTTKTVSYALNNLKINFDQESVDKLFSTREALASEMSARQLRDKIAHQMKPQHRSAVRERYASLMGTMMKFLSAVEAWRSRCRGSATKDGGPSPVR